MTFLSAGSKSKNLQANTAACLSALAKDHRENQDLIVRKRAVKPLVTLAKSPKTVCQVNAASALEALATNNPEAQVEIDGADAQRPLIRLLKMWAIEVKEQGLCDIIYNPAFSLNLSVTVPCGLWQKVSFSQCLSPSRCVNQQFAGGEGMEGVISI